MGFIDESDIDGGQGGELRTPLPPLYQSSGDDNQRGVIQGGGLPFVWDRQ
jgi:hypothetical protein